MFDLVPTLAVRVLSILLPYTTPIVPGLISRRPREASTRRDRDRCLGSVLPTSGDHCSMGTSLGPTLREILPAAKLIRSRRCQTESAQYLPGSHRNPSHSQN